MLSIQNSEDFAAFPITYCQMNSPEDVLMVFINTSPSAKRSKVLAFCIEKDFRNAEIP